MYDDSNSVFTAEQDPSVNPSNTMDNMDDIDDDNNNGKG